ncbi:acetyltransferase (GNAT) family protein [Shimia isoporae]|uniref:Acetyltransferase (GNAT) family protein n=1 Tax=Shimia isoporae TaxID=647720 RepID=A0A4R1N2T8_9RHOB|nr:GNAT family N-acetyltransferase [Shimia isoporae]TCL00548.1 acetyltransferase (GNAT) family protein [Shimia isoporae]
MLPRLAHDYEAEAIARLIDAAYQPYRDQGVILPDVSGGIDRAIAAGQVWVAGRAEVQGVLMVAIAPPKAHLMNVAVSPDARGKGLGGKLIGHAVALAKDAGCSEIALATHEDLASIIALYHHLGWQETGREGNRVMMSRTI